MAQGKKGTGKARVKADLAVEQAAATPVDVPVEAMGDDDGPDLEEQEPVVTKLEDAVVVPDGVLAQQADSALIRGDGDVAPADPAVAKPPLRYLEHPELREAWVEILALRVMREPIPEHLAINDNLVFTSNAAALKAFALMRGEGAEPTLENARAFANRVIP